MRTVILMITVTCFACGGQSSGESKTSSETYCSARGPVTKAEAEAADAGDLAPCLGMCVPFAGGG
jgi:hypothetical protein